VASAEAAERLWDLAWKGAVSSDSFQAVRRGIAHGFRVEQAAREDGRRRRGFDRWQASRPGGGFWFRVEQGTGPRDALDAEEIARDRIRQVLQRSGVVFRELLEAELAPLRWSRLFRSLRLMEFSGEVVAGRFFDGVSGLQFALPSVLGELAALGEEAAGNADEVWWLNATDPASLCGVEVSGLKATLPSRLPTTHVVFHGSAVVLISRRKGRELEIRVAPDAPRIPDYLSFVKVLTGREQRPMGAVHVERINGQPALQSPFKDRLVECGFAEDYRRLTWRASI
jgi:ATP-dependent Lhr-like helicase